MRVFLPPYQEVHEQGDWYGEHVGKWLIAASRAAHRRDDGLLSKKVKEVVEILRQRQEPDGRISSYPPGASARYDHPDAGSTRTWDLWIQAYLMLGLLEASAIDSEAAALAASVAESIAASVERNNLRIRGLGNHSGFSATVILEPICRIGRLTGSPTLRRLAERLILEMRQDLIDPVLGGKPLSEVGTGKIYQLLWTLVGILSYGEWTGEDWPVRLAEMASEDVRLHHLTPAGGPWGGVGKHKEVFNSRGFFSPYGMVETCSTWCWMQLSRELYRATGKSGYLDAVERSTFNQLLGAMSPDGSEWIYFSFPNGQRNTTYDWACCKSSGAAGWEELAPLMYQERGDDLQIGLYGLSTFAGKNWRVDQTCDFPAPDAQLTLHANQAGTILLRRPEWAKTFQVTLDGEAIALGPDDGWARVPVSAGRHALHVSMPFETRLETRTASLDHHGQEIMRMDYYSVLHGPWCMATGLIEDYKMEETVRLAKLNGAQHFVPYDGSTNELVWHRPDGPSLRFLPYYLAGGREMGRWRTTWLQVAWQ